MKRTIFVFLLLLGCHLPASAFFLDMISSGVENVANKAKQIKDEIFEDTMIKNTIDSLGVLKRNYDESMSFYADVKRIQNDPQSILNDSLSTFMTGFGDPKQDVIDKVNASSQKEKGILGKLHDTAKAKELAWLDENITIADWVKQKVDAHNKILEKAASDMRSTDKNKVESAKNLLMLLQTNVLVNTERMLADLMKQSAEKAKEQYSKELDVMNVQQDMIDAINGIYSNQPYSHGEEDRKKELLDRIQQQPQRSQRGGQ